MNLKILLIILLAATISSCSTTYKSGQTPDDVYYSPARPGNEARQDQEVKKERNTIARNEYRDPQIVMSVYDRRWRYFNDDYDAYYDPYRYGYSCGYYYNPYYYPCPVYISGSTFINPKNTVPRMANLGSYNYSNMVVINPKTNATTLVRSTRAYNNSNNDQSYIRRIITPTYNNTSTNNSYQPSNNNTRTYSPSTNSSSGSSSNSSSGTSVPRPHRGG